MDWPHTRPSPPPRANYLLPSPNRSGGGDGADSNGGGASSSRKPSTSSSSQVPRARGNFRARARGSRGGDRGRGNRGRGRGFRGGGRGFRGGGRGFRGRGRGFRGGRGFRSGRGASKTPSGRGASKTPSGRGASTEASGRGRGRGSTPRGSNTVARTPRGTSSTPKTRGGVTRGRGRGGVAPLFAACARVHAESRATSERNGARSVSSAACAATNIGSTRATNPFSTRAPAHEAPVAASSSVTSSSSSSDSAAPSFLSLASIRRQPAASSTAAVNPTMSSSSSSEANRTVDPTTPSSSSAVGNRNPASTSSRVRHNGFAVPRARPLSSISASANSSSSSSSSTSLAQNTGSSASSSSTRNANASGSMSRPVSDPYSTSSTSPSASSTRPATSNGFVVPRARPMSSHVNSATSSSTHPPVAASQSSQNRTPSNVSNNATRSRGFNPPRSIPVRHTPNPQSTSSSSSSAAARLPSASSSSSSSSSSPSAAAVGGTPERRRSSFGAHFLSPLHARVAPAPRQNFLLSREAASAAARKSSVPASEQQYTNHLNDKQKLAALSTSGPLMILAAPGSGKTMTITTRISFFLREGISGSDILAITFTRKAADEMRSRVGSQIGWDAAKGLTISNFHQLCLKILRDNYQAVGFSHQFSVLGASEQRDLVFQCIKQWQAASSSSSSRVSGSGRERDLNRLASSASSGVDADADDAMIDDVLGDEIGGRHYHGGGGSGKNSRAVSYMTTFIRKAKQKGKGPKDYPDEHGEIFERYLRMLKLRSAIDFNDMIPLTICLFQRIPQILNRYRNRFKYVLCDEFQDVSRDQFVLLRMIAQQHGRITVCGDDDQAIFGWRGGSVESFQMFEKAFPTHEKIVLDQTYRSSKRIVNAFTSIIAHNKERTAKQVWTENDEGENLKLIVCRDLSVESTLIVNEISRLHSVEAVPYREMAVLARTRKVMFDLQEKLKRANIPVANALVAQQAWQRSKEVLDLLAYADLLLSDDADAAFLRIYNTPARKIGASTLEAVRELGAARHKSHFAAAKICALSSQATGDKNLSKRARDAIMSFVQLINTMRRKSRGKSPADVFDIIIGSVGYYEHLSKKGAKNSSGGFSQGGGADNKAAKSLEIRRSNIEKLVKAARKFDEHTRDGRVKRQASLDSSASATAHVDATYLGNFLPTIRSRSNHGTNEDGERKPKERELVTLSTIHQAKGREWDVVFVKGFNEGVLPLPIRTNMEPEPMQRRKSTDKENVKNTSNKSQTGSQRVNDRSGMADMKEVRSQKPVNHLEEERRLAYVALSRARQKLIISFSMKDQFGTAMVPSRFLSEIPEKLIESIGERTVLPHEAMQTECPKPVESLPGFQTATAKMIDDACAKDLKKCSTREERLALQRQKALEWKKRSNPFEIAAAGQRSAAPSCARQSTASLSTGQPAASSATPTIPASKRRKIDHGVTSAPQCGVLGTSAASPRGSRPAATCSTSSSLSFRRPRRLSQVDEPPDSCAISQTSNTTTTGSSAKKRKRAVSTSESSAHNSRDNVASQCFVPETQEELVEEGGASSFRADSSSHRYRPRNPFSRIRVGANKRRRTAEAGAGGRGSSEGQIASQIIGASFPDALPPPLSAAHVSVTSTASSNLGRSNFDRVATSSNLDRSNFDRLATSSNLDRSNFDRVATSSNLDRSNFDRVATSSNFDRSNFDHMATSDRSRVSTSPLGGRGGPPTQSQPTAVPVRADDVFAAVLSSSTSALSDDSIASKAVQQRNVSASHSLNRPRTLREASHSQRAPLRTSNESGNSSSKSAKFHSQHNAACASNSCGGAPPDYRSSDSRSSEVARSSRHANVSAAQSTRGGEAAASSSPSEVSCEGSTLTPAVAADPAVADPFEVIAQCDSDDGVSTNLEPAAAQTKKRKLKKRRKSPAAAAASSSSSTSLGGLAALFQPKFITAAAARRT